MSLQLYSTFLSPLASGKPISVFISAPPLRRHGEDPRSTVSDRWQVAHAPLFLFQLCIVLCLEMDFII